MIAIELTLTSTKKTANNKPQANVSYKDNPGSGTIIIQPLRGNAKAEVRVAKLEKGKRYRFEGVGIVSDRCTTVYVSDKTVVSELA